MRLLRRLWIRAWPRAKPSAEFGETSERLNRLLEAIFLREKARVVQGGYPFGISVIAVAEKPAKPAGDAGDARAPGGTAQ